MKIIELDYIGGYVRVKSRLTEFFRDDIYGIFNDQISN